MGEYFLACKERGSGAALFLASGVIRDKFPRANFVGVSAYVGPNTLVCQNKARSYEQKAEARCFHSARLLRYDRDSCTTGCA